MTDRVEIEWQTLKLMWKRAEHWFAESRGGTANTRFTPKWKLSARRRLAEDCWDRYEAAADRMLPQLHATGEMNQITGPEIERQQFKRKPPRRNDYKEAA